MWLKALCLVIIISNVFGVDDFLSNLYGLEQRNKALLCLKATPTLHERECTGALVHDQWVGARAGCLRKHPLNHIFVIRPVHAGDVCADISYRYSSPYARSARAVYYHPWADLAIVNVDTPFFQLDRHPNSTRWTAPRAFKKHGTWKWMKKYIDEFALQRNPHHYYSILQRTMIANRSPLLVMFLTLVLPILILVLVYIYVIHYPDFKSQISYKNLKSVKKASQV